MNNKGMTLVSEIIIIVLFMLLAFLSLYIATKSFNTNFNNKVVNYKQYEKKLEEAARKYIDNKNIIEKTIITADTLKQNNLFDSKCDGYVIIDNNYYDAYIKCGTVYKTNGYTDVLTH